MKFKIGKYIKSEIVIDDEDYSVVNNLNLYFSQKGAQAKIDNKFVYLRYLLAGIKSSGDSTKIVIHANKDKLDFRKENLKVITRKEIVADRDYRYAARKTRGAIKYKGTWYCNKTFDSVFYKIICKTEEEALQMYDAISDYLGATGHRNFPDKKFILTDAKFAKFGKYKRKK